MITAQAVGRLTADPELRYTAGGTPVASIRIACDKYNGGEGTDYITINYYGENRAEAAATHLTKGQQITAAGHLDQSHWEDKQTGANRDRFTLTADRIKFGRKPGDAPANTDAPAQDGEPF